MSGFAAVKVDSLGNINDVNDMEDVDIPTHVRSACNGGPYVNLNTSDDVHGITSMEEVTCKLKGIKVSDILSVCLSILYLSVHLFICCSHINLCRPDEASGIPVCWKILDGNSCH